MMKTSLKRRRPEYRRLTVTALVLGVVAALLVGLQVRSHASPVVATPAAAVTSSKVIDPSDDLSLAPPSTAVDSTAQTLTPDQAWADYAATVDLNEPTVPSRLSVQIGSLSIPISDLGDPSDWTYNVKDSLVYAYTMNTPCVSTLPPAGADPECVEWTFLDAVSGAHIETTYVPVNPQPSSTASATNTSP
jgi:hypothetical protein